MRKLINKRALVPAKRDFFELTQGIKCAIDNNQIRIYTLLIYLIAPLIHINIAFFTLSCYLKYYIRLTCSFSG